MHLPDTNEIKVLTRERNLLSRLSQRITLPAQSLHFSVTMIVSGTRCILVILLLQFVEAKPSEGE